MEETTTSGGGIQWLWGVASAAQMGWGVRTYLKGHAGDSCLMPLKAFSVASLFIGSAASASIFILHANDIHGVDDLIEAGANLRAKLGLRPRTSNNIFLLAALISPLSPSDLPRFSDLAVLVEATRNMDES